MRINELFWVIILPLIIVFLLCFYGLHIQAQTYTKPLRGRELFIILPTTGGSGEAHQFKDTFSPVQQDPSCTQHPFHYYNFFWKAIILWREKIRQESWLNVFLISVPALESACWVTLGKLISHSVSQFPSLWNRTHHQSYLLGCCGE